MLDFREEAQAMIRGYVAKLPRGQRRMLESFLLTLVAGAMGLAYERGKTQAERWEGNCWSIAVEPRQTYGGYDVRY